jgi:glycerophosphoryl diester phosphodiesterase
MKFLLFLIGMSMPLFSKQPLIIAHRGASGYEPENTLCSFRRALDMGADMIELDVYVCKSGEVVVIHDETIDRTTNGIGSVAELNWATLQTYDAGKGESIPLLSQVFDLVDKRLIINVELKDIHAAQPVAQLIAEYIQNKQWSYNHFIISSFDHDALVRLRAYNPLLHIGALFEGGTEQVFITKELGAKYVIVDYESVTKNLVDTAHANGLEIFAYTVNTAQLAHVLQRLAIDGIITNYPDILQR